jgi:hypothetical protein
MQRDSRRDWLNPFGTYEYESGMLIVVKNVYEA